MTGITRYIFRQLLVGIVLVSLALVCIAWLKESLGLLQFVVTKGLALSAWLKLTLYLMPIFLGVVIPPAFFFVTLFVYNKLIMDRELVVAQAAGVSRLQLARPALLAAGVGAIACYLLSLYVAPGSQGAFREMRYNIRYDAARVILREGAFNQIASGLTIYVRGRGENGELLGIMVHDARTPGRPVTWLAEQGAIVDQGGGTPQVMLLNGTRQELDPTGNRNEVLAFESHAIEFGTVAATGTRAADYRERSLGELLRLDESDGLSAGDIGKMRAEAHQRLAGPLNALGFTVVALVFLLRGSFDRQGQLPRVAGAVVALIALEAAWLGSINLVAGRPALAPLLYMVGLLPTAVGLYIIARPLRWVGTGALPAAST